VSEGGRSAPQVQLTGLRHVARAAMHADETRVVTPASHPRYPTCTPAGTCRDPQGISGVAESVVQLNTPSHGLHAVRTRKEPPQHGTERGLRCQEARLERSTSLPTCSSPPEEQRNLLTRTSPAQLSQPDIYSVIPAKDRQFYADKCLFQIKTMLLKGNGLHTAWSECCTWLLISTHALLPMSRSSILSESWLVCR
jgi:hypothetical protein